MGLFGLETVRGGVVGEVKQAVPDHVNAALQTMVRHWIHSKNTGQPLDGLGQGSDKG